MKSYRFLFGILLTALTVVSSAQAHHVVWLDFSEFSLSAWNKVNGGDPEDAVDAVQARIVATIIEDYAPFDVYFTIHQPAYGRYTRVRFLSSSVSYFNTGTLESGFYFGCAGGSCCAGGTCTGIGSWDDEGGLESACEIYAGSFASFSDFQGANATIPKISRGISHTASHELGHIIELEHCNAADDSISGGCSDPDTFSTGDTNVNWHIMSTASPWGLTMQQRALLNRFFSIHSSRRVLFGELQARNHWDTLANLNGGSGYSDLVVGRLDRQHAFDWHGRLSTGSAFGSSSTWQNDAGEAGDLIMLGDVDGDGKEDLVLGAIQSSTQVEWSVLPSTGSGFGTASVWRTDGGDVGAIFRLAAVDGDGMDDLVFGRPYDESTVTWYVRPSTGSSFGSYSTWRDDAGDIGDIFLLGDLGGDGDADLLYGRYISDTQVKWYGRFSTGSGFGSYSVWHDDAGDKGDVFYLGDLGGDGDADLLYGRTFSDSQITWYGRYSTGSDFDALTTWHANAGNAGDLHRIGDGDGDGKADLFYGRNTRMDDLTSTPDLSVIEWFGRMSTGSAFDSLTVWNGNGGEEGDLFP